MSSLLIAYIVLSGLGTVLNLVPFVWQIRHGNSGPSCLILWTILGNVNNFVGLPLIFRNVGLRH